jgi:hypothetical protein
MRVLVIALTLTGFVVAEASAQNYKVQPENFVGKAEACGPGYPAGAKIVSSSWVNGLGVPDQGQFHPAGNNKHEGLLLSKNGPTDNCSAATAAITVDNDPDDIEPTITTLSFDYRNGTSCGAGAPRFNVYTTSGTFFYGCAGGVASPAPQNPSQWTRVTHSGLTHTDVTGIEIIFDEGTDTALPPDAPAGPGLVILDNIRINNTVITRKSGNTFTP